VAGVSGSEGAGSVEVSDEASSATGSCVCSDICSGTGNTAGCGVCVSASLSGAFKAGNASVSTSSIFCLLLLRLAARGGNDEAPPSCEYHGNLLAVFE
jgi:hypothetical protein